jgi:hypothetical protein
MGSWTGWIRSSDGEENLIASITINDVEYELLSIDKLTFDEQSELKKLTGGLSLQKIAQGLDEMDVDAWRGVILVSVQKQNPRFRPATLGALNMVDLIAAINDDADVEEPTEDPPPVATGLVAESPNGSPISSGSGATPETPGIPTSLASSD